MAARCSRSQQLNATVLFTFLKDVAVILFFYAILTLWITSQQMPINIRCI